LSLTVFQIGFGSVDVVIPYLVFLLALSVAIVLLQVYRSSKKVSEQLRVEAYCALDYKITVLVKATLYILVFFSLLTFISAFGELIDIGALDVFVYLLIIAIVGFGFSLIHLFREAKRVPQTSPSFPIVSELDSAEKKAASNALKTDGEIA
jgi:hypothetical protein